MRRFYVVFATLILVALVTPAFAGNGAPNGTHYNLNILGKDNCAGSTLTGSNRHTIQVLLNYHDDTTTGQLYTTLDKRNKIFLTEGEFQVIDGNACDSNGAKFSLPANPITCDLADPACVNDPTFQNYTVWARALGKPGGSANMTTCTVGAGDDLTLHTPDDEIICSMESVVLVRSTRKSTFTNYTKELTTLLADIDGDGTAERVQLFDSAFYDYFWDYDNFGLRLAQLRFYPIGE